MGNFGMGKVLRFVDGVSVFVRERREPQQGMFSPALRLDFEAV